ncbi:MAG: hypothetical protein IT267_07670 [Saprospiraceae bacterium]|nr:hypothetical protein [Saprospiraceae bacterium]
MKSNIFWLLVLLSIKTSAQFNVARLLDQAPLVPVSFGTAYMNSKLVTKSEMLDDGREFKRVKSWDPSPEISKFDDLINKHVEKIDARADYNSFSLSNSTLDSKEDKEYLHLMDKVSDSLYSVWKNYYKKLSTIGGDFYPLSEEFGCDEIKASGLKLNIIAEQKNKILIEARIQLKPMFDLVQRYFNKLYLIQDPMINNEVLNYISKPLEILQQWMGEVNVTNGHMVETGISLNNALCMINAH